jgi:hypothetical protein
MTADDRTQALVSGVLDRVRASLADELGRLVDELRAQAAEEREAARTTARVEAETAAAALISEAIAAERAALEDRIREAREQILAEAQAALSADAQAAERQSGLERAGRLLAGVRALDGASSLSEALDALTAAARAEAGRAAVFLVREGDLRGWSHFGFDRSMPAARTLTWPSAEAGLLSKAVAERRMVDTSSGERPPAELAPGSTDRVGVAVPLLVGGRPVAVVYVDDAGDEAREVPSAWPEHVELLARHASRCLEALTARGAMQARSGRAPGPITITSAGSTDEDSGDEDESARRYARLLISEIRLYHEATVEAGQQARDLLARLKPQIERARRLYEERVPAASRARADFFGQELIRTLANGDAALLGHGL